MSNGEVRSTGQEAKDMEIQASPPDVNDEFDPQLQDLFLEFTKDEDLNPAITFKDKEGKLWVHILAKLPSEDSPVPSEIDLGARIEDILTGAIRVEDIKDLIKGHRRLASLKAAVPLNLDLHKSVRDVQCDTASLQTGLPDHPGLDGSGVVIGVVDTDFDFRHWNFRRPPLGTTRLYSLWDQSNDDPDQLGLEPYGYGREFTAKDINDALCQVDPYKALDYEPAIAGHGTHVADIAAGNGGEDAAPGGSGIAPPGVAPNAQIIFVHLVSDQRGFLGSSRHLLDAVHYVFTKADKLGLPAVVNVSLSTTGGPHDGSTLIEQGFERLLKKDGRAIVLSAGNSYGSQGHRKGDVPARSTAGDAAGPNAPVRIGWRLDPRAFKNEMDVWYSGDRALMVWLENPSGRRYGPVHPGQTALIKAGGKVIGRISHRRRDPNNGDNQIAIRLYKKPERWIVQLATEEDKAVPFHAWIEQNDQGTARFTGGSNPSHTLSSIGCGASTILVGAYDTFESAALHPPYEATSAGPTRKGEPKPDVGAPGVSIVAARGVLGGTLHMTGTSMAAPHVTGLVALLFQLARKLGHPPLPIATTRTLLRDAAVPIGFKHRLGKGRIDGVNTLQALLEFHRRAAVQPAAETPELESVQVPGNGPVKLELPAIEAWLKETLGPSARLVFETCADRGGNSPPAQETEAPLAAAESKKVPGASKRR
jgi:subtilisin family serine protease